MAPRSAFTMMRATCSRHSPNSNQLYSNFVGDDFPGEPDAISNAIGYAKTAGGPDRAADEVKLVYAKNTKWLLSGPYQL